VDVPDDEFKNARREPFVRCYLKGKEGYLFLLQHGALLTEMQNACCVCDVFRAWIMATEIPYAGVIFGLKKPIIYIPFGDITDIQTQATSSRYGGRFIGRHQHLISRYKHCPLRGFTGLLLH
jgi:hypothetical protein